MLLLIFQVRVVRSLISIFFVHFNCFGNVRRGKHVKLFAIGKTLFNTCKLNVDYLSSTIGKPDHLHRYGPFPNNLTQVLIVTRAEQSTYRLIKFNFIFSFSVIFRGFISFVQPYFFSQPLYVAACTKVF